MRFRDTYLYAHLKQAAYTGSRFFEKRSGVISSVSNGASSLGKGASGLWASTVATSNDIGRTVGVGLGDLFWDLASNEKNFDNSSEIYRLMNKREEILLLEREAEKLERLARIQARKKKRLNEAAARAVRSPFI